MGDPKAAGIRPGERYTIRRKMLRVFGASFHVFDEQGSIVAYCKQKAFKLREDIRIFTSEAMETELLSLSARTIMDFSTTYDVRLPTGESLGSLRRKGLKSSFLRDEWMVFDAEGEEIALIREKNGSLALLRRVNETVAAFSPQTFDITRAGDGAALATLRQHFNPFVYRMGVTLHAEDERVDELVILAAACLVTAIEGRQS